MFLCHILDIQVQRSPLVSPEALITKPESAPPSCWCVQCSNASGTNWITLRTRVICQYTDESWQWVHLNSMWGVSKAVRISLSLLLALQVHHESVCQPLGAVGGQNNLSNHHDKCFSKSLSSKIIPVESDFSEKGFSRLHFVVVLSKFLVIISKDHSLLYWKL